MSDPEFAKYHVLHVNVKEAVNIPKLGLITTANPYCKLYIEGNEGYKLRTRVVLKSLKPVWDQAFHFILDKINCALCVEIWSKSTLKKDVFIATLRVPISDSNYNRINDTWSKCVFQGKIGANITTPVGLRLVLHLCHPGSVLYKNDGNLDVATKYFSHFIANKSNTAKNVHDQEKNGESEVEQFDIPSVPIGMMAPWMIKQWMLIDE